MLAGSLLSFNMQILMTFESPMLEVYLPNLVCKEFSFSRCFLESSDNVYTFRVHRSHFPQVPFHLSQAFGSRLFVLPLWSPLAAQPSPNSPPPKHNSVCIFSTCTSQHHFSADLGLKKNHNKKASHNCHWRGHPRGYNLSLFHPFFPSLPSLGSLVSSHGIGRSTWFLAIIPNYPKGKQSAAMPLCRDHWFHLLREQISSLLEPQHLQSSLQEKAIYFKSPWSSRINPFKLAQP